MLLGERSFNSPATTGYNDGSGSGTDSSFFLRRFSLLIVSFNFGSMPNIAVVYEFILSKISRICSKILGPVSPKSPPPKLFPPFPSFPEGNVFSIVSFTFSVALTTSFFPASLSVPVLAFNLFVSAFSSCATLPILVKVIVFSKFLLASVANLAKLVLPVTGDSFLFCVLVLLPEVDVLPGLYLNFRKKSPKAFNI